MLDWILALIGSGLLLAIGISGIVGGRRVARRHGPTHRMSYPFPHPRLRAKVMSARATVRVGALIAVASPGLFVAMIGWDTVSPWAIARRAASACRHLFTADELRELTGVRAEVGRVSDDGKSCRATFERDTARGTRALARVEVRPERFFNPTTDREQERLADKGMTIERLGRSGEDRRDFIAWAEEDTRWHIALVVRSGVEVRLELDAEQLGERETRALVSQVVERKRLLEPYRK
jgi:hypothetical protein